MDIETLLTQLRSGDDVAAQLRNMLAPMVLAQLKKAASKNADRYTGEAFMALAAAVDELRGNDIPADQAIDYVLRRTAYAPRRQKQHDANFLGVPESTRRTRAARGQHVPRVGKLSADLSDGHSDRERVIPAGRRWESSPGIVHKEPTPFAPSARQECDELLPHAKTKHEWSVARGKMSGLTHEAIAEMLAVSLRRVQRTVTILRHRAGYTYPEPTE